MSKKKKTLNVSSHNWTWKSNNNKLVIAKKFSEMKSFFPSELVYSFPPRRLNFASTQETIQVDFRKMTLHSCVLWSALFAVEQKVKFRKFFDRGLLWQGKETKTAYCTFEVTAIRKWLKNFWCNKRSKMYETAYWKDWDFNNKTY